MAGTRLFYKLQFCGTTDCTTSFSEGFSDRK